MCAPHWRLPKVAGNLSTSISLGPSTMSAPDCARRPFCSSSTTKKARGTGGSRHKGKNKAAQATVDEEDTEEQAELQQEVLRLEEQPGFIKGGRMRDYQVLASYRGSPALARMQSSLCRLQARTFAATHAEAPFVPILPAVQLEGLNWLLSLHSRGLNGILADEMGLGKTLQTISFLSQLTLMSGVKEPHLVVVPLSVLGNWQREIAGWSPRMRTLKLHGTKDERVELVQQLKARCRARRPACFLCPRAPPPPAPCAARARDGAPAHRTGVGRGASSTSA